MIAILISSAAGAASIDKGRFRLRNALDIFCFLLAAPYAATLVLLLVLLMSRQ
jgi:hypothetical protein